MRDRIRKLLIGSVLCILILFGLMLLLYLFCSFWPLDEKAHKLESGDVLPKAVFADACENDKAGSVCKENIVLINGHRIIPTFVSAVGRSIRRAAR